MTRISIDLPERFLFETEIPVRVSDLNYGGHVGNDSILTLIQEARVLYYRSLGFNNETGFEGDISQIITDAVVLYKAESFLGDVLIIRIGIEEFTKYGFIMVYLIENKITGKEVARARTGIVCFDYTKRKIASIPSLLLQKLKN